MAIHFDGTDDYYSIADAASLTLQDGDWCVGIWTYVSSNSGSLYQYLVSNNSTSVNSSLNIYLQEDAAPTANNWTALVKDDDGTSSGYLFAGATGADSTWRLVLVQHDTGANEIQLWLCEAGAAAANPASAADTDFAAVNGGNWYIAQRADGDADRRYNSIACEFFKGNFALTEAEITALGAGLRPQDLGHIPDIYLEMFTADATLRDCFGSNDATRNSAPTSVTHQPIMRTPRPVMLY